MVFLPRGISWPFCFPRSGTSGWPGRLRPGPPSAFGPTGPHSWWDTWARTCLSIPAGEWALPSPRPFTTLLPLHHSSSSLSTQSEFLPSPPPSQVPLSGGSCEVLVRGEAALLVSCPKGLYPALPLALPWPCLLPLYPGTLCRAEGLVGEIECGGQQPVWTSFYIMSLFLYIHWTELNWILYWVS